MALTRRETPIRPCLRGVQHSGNLRLPRGAKVIRPTRHTTATRLIAIGAALVATLPLATRAPARPLSRTLRTATATTTATATQAGPVAATPPMGWNDWYTFFCDVNEQLVEQTADAM